MTTTTISSNGLIVDPALEEELLRVDKLSTEAPRNVLLAGPQGCGKTGTFHHFVSITNRENWIKMPCGVIVDPDEWYGTTIAKDGSTHIMETEFTKMVQTPRAAILLDDFGRSLSPKILSGLFGLLDDTAREQYIPSLQKTIKVADGVVFFATYNQSVMSASYVGQDPLDFAVIDRFRTISMNYPPLEVERRIGESRGLSSDDATSLANLFQILRSRGFEFSTRQLIQVAETRKFGASWADAFKYTCLHSPSSGSGDRADQVLQLLQMESGEGL